jgi:hypothetical protein
MPTCQFNGEIIGNVIKAQFRDIWDGVLRAKQRQWVQQCPGCWAECEVMPSTFYSGDIFFNLLKNMHLRRKKEG